MRTPHEPAIAESGCWGFYIALALLFAVPRSHQQKVLMIGIIIALILRGVFIDVGAVLIENVTGI